MVKHVVSPVFSSPLKIWGLLFLLFTNAGIMKADHIIAAELSYTCIDAFTYKVRYTFYRDCAGAGAPGEPYGDKPPLNNVLQHLPVLKITSPSCGITLSDINMPKIQHGIIINDIDTLLCSSGRTTCNGGTFMGIQQWIYETIVRLPQRCTDWTFTVNICCRNNIITTLQTDPTKVSANVSAMVNNANFSHNNSPYFFIPPVIETCVGQGFCMNNFGKDIDGDSLTYELVSPQGGVTPDINNTLPIIYKPGYDLTNPLKAQAPYSMDVFSGTICLTPAIQEATIMAVQIKEYRNGIVVGSIIRDMQVLVRTCTNKLPSLDGINGSNIFSGHIFANAPFCFNTQAVDSDATQTVDISLLDTLSGASFNLIGNNTASFCWTPTSADVQNNPHCFLVKVKDNNCPIPGERIYSFCLTVNPDPASIIVKNITNSFHFSLQPNPNDGIFNLHITSEVPQKTFISIVNLLGETVHQSTIMVNKGTHSYSFSLSHLPEGTYYSTLTTSDNNICTRMMILK